MYDLAVLPRDVLENRELGDREKVVYMLIKSYSRDNIIAFPSLESVAESLGVSISTIKRATKKLKERGYIKVYREHYKSVNNYIFIPVEWVDGEILDADEYYIDDEEEFNDLVEKIKKYYADRADYTDFTKSKMELLEEKLDEKDYNFTAEELVLVFVKYMREIKDIAYSVKWGRDIKIMQRVFIEEQYIDGEDAVNLIRKFIEVYDERFKREGYESPQIRYLGVDWIFTKVLRLLILEEEAENSGEWLEEGEELQEEF